MTISLFTLDATKQEPKPSGGLDAQGIVIAEDGLPYLLKKPTEDNPTMAANEWLCCKIASQCTVPSPTVAKLNYNGEKCVGIRIEGGTSDDYTDPNDVQISSDYHTPSALNTVCSAAVIDLFLYNPDRHLNNFMTRRSIAGTSMFAIDYSRAFLSNWPLPPVSEIKTTPTMQTLLFTIKLNGRKDTTAIERVCNKMDKISTDMMQLWINEMPAPWLSDKLRCSTIEWFDSEKDKRMDEVKEVLNEI